MADEGPVAPGMEPLMRRKSRTVLPPKRPAVASSPTPDGTKEVPESDQTPTANEPEKEPTPKTRIKRQVPSGGAAEENDPVGDVSALVNLNIRVRRGIDDRIASCAFGLREFGLRNVSKAELVELAVLDGPLPGKASSELAAKVAAFRARYPRP